MGLGWSQAGEPAGPPDGHLESTIIRIQLTSHGEAGTGLLAVPEHPKHTARPVPATGTTTGRAIDGESSWAQG
ncbi:hypothetical protein GCM10022377_14030 [Zhihengliuella alba]|uniref:Uncharacterized protein n=1 Tax=Zhihengliuella alba TaxID=547018 RepID=A0ABP7DD66_9MICC